MRIGRLLVVGLLGAMAFAAPASAKPHGTTIRVSGHWYNAGPCVPTGVVPDPRHLGDATLTCDGSSVWTGTWAGLTDFALTAHGNLVTDDIKGSLSELFIGAAGHRTGTLLFHETFKLAHGRIRIVAKIVGATGKLAGSTGRVIFTGTVTPATNGFGSYHGCWHVP